MQNSLQRNAARRRPCIFAQALDIQLQGLLSVGRCLVKRVGGRHDTPRKPGKPTTSHDDTTRARREQSNRTATAACGRDVKTARDLKTQPEDPRHLTNIWFVA